MSDQQTNETRIKREELSSPMSIFQLIYSGNIKLPVWVDIGPTSFQINEENMSSFWLGALYATDPEWKS